MSTATYTPITNSSVNKIWRSVQGDLATGINFDCEEFDGIDDFQCGAGMIEKQIVFQGRHKIRDMARHTSDYFYGLSTAVLALKSRN